MRGQTAIVTPVAVNASTPVNLVSNNVNRVGVYLRNDTGTLYVKFGPGADQALYTSKMAAGDEKMISNWTGVISGIKGSGNSTVYVTEIW